VFDGHLRLRHHGGRGTVTEAIFWVKATETSVEHVSCELVGKPVRGTIAPGMSIHLDLNRSSSMSFSITRVSQDALSNEQRLTISTPDKLTVEILAGLDIRDEEVVCSFPEKEAQ
jgi:hypothetical protein